MGHAPVRGSRLRPSATDVVACTIGAIRWPRGGRTTRRAGPTAQAGIGPEDIDLFELHDAFTIMAALCLEAAGFAAPGTGMRLALRARLPWMGGCPCRRWAGSKAAGIRWAPRACTRS